LPFGAYAQGLHYLALPKRVGQDGPPAKSALEDHDRNACFEVVLVPNPQLSADQKQTIERDYGMSDGRAVVRVRRAMLYYFDKRLRLDVAEKQDRPKETPVTFAQTVKNQP
jgi:hypothetical protein